MGFKKTRLLAQLFNGTAVTEVFQPCHNENNDNNDSREKTQQAQTHNKKKKKKSKLH